VCAMTVNLSDPTLAKVRAILALEGVTGQAGEVAINLTNQPDSQRLFRNATVTVEGPFGVSVSTEDTFFLAIRPEGEVVVHVGPNGGTTARFSITKVDSFAYCLARKTTSYTFVEHHQGGETKVHVTVHW